jgi:hypothetical protein
MVNFKRLTDKAKGAVDKRGGMDSLKEDASELREVAKGKGSLKDKAKAAGKAIKDPGEKGPERAGGERPHKQPPGNRPEADQPGTRSK